MLNLSAENVLLTGECPFDDIHLWDVLSTALMESKHSFNLKNNGHVQ